MCALIEKMVVNLDKNKKGWTKFATKPSWNEKMLKNQQFSFLLQNLQLQFLRLYLHFNLNVTNEWLVF